MICFCIVFIIYTIDFAIRRDNGTKLVFNEVIGHSESCKLWHITNDGFCDDEANIEICHFDQGDCCDQYNDQSLCTECLCKEGPSLNGTQKYDCGYPLSPRWWDLKYVDG